MNDLIERLRACADSESRHDGITDDLLREAAAALKRADRLAEALREIESVAQGYVKDVASDYLRDYDQEVGNG